MPLSKEEMWRIAEREATLQGFLPICSWASVKNDCLVVTLMSKDKKTSRNAEVFPEDDEQAIVDKIASKVETIK